MVMSVAQGGSGFPFLAEPVFDYLCTGRCTGISINIPNIPDPTLQFVVHKVYMINTKISVLEEAQYTTDTLNSAYHAGYRTVYFLLVY